MQTSGLLDTLSPQERRMQEVGAGGGRREEAAGVGRAAWVRRRGGGPRVLAFHDCLLFFLESFRGGNVRGFLPALPAAADRHFRAEPGTPGHAHPP